MVTIEASFALHTLDLAPRHLVFPHGLMGFPQYREFLLEADPATLPLLNLNCLVADVGFIVASPMLFEPDYSVQLSDADSEGLGHPSQMDVVLLAIITPPVMDGERANGGRHATVNLMGPLVINLANDFGRQIMQPGCPSHFDLVNSRAC